MVQRFQQTAGTVSLRACTLDYRGASAMSVRLDSKQCFFHINESKASMVLSRKESRYLFFHREKSSMISCRV